MYQHLSIEELDKRNGEKLKREIGKVPTVNGGLIFVLLYLFFSPLILV